MPKPTKYSEEIPRTLPNGNELRCLNTSAFPKAIIHIDMDSFFASVAQEQDHTLRGKPVTIGSERGIATSMSWEAKQAGVTRGMKNKDIKDICPDCILVPSDYETIGLFSKRLFEIVRRYTPDVEEYSVDECFADITGMRRVHNMTYEQICLAVKHDIDTKLGTKCSVGLSSSKTLCKLASKWKKPSGFAMIPANRAQYFLNNIKVDDVWNIGRARAQALNKQGIYTAYQFANKPEAWAKTLYKPERETYYELRGVYVKKLETEGVTTYDGISKRKTFTPSTSDKHEVWSRLFKNIENATMKARRFGLGTSLCKFSIKSTNFIHYGREIRLNQVCNDPMSFIEAIEPHFNAVFSSQIRWRTTQFSMHKLQINPEQVDLFNNYQVASARSLVYQEVDDLNKRFGKHSIKLASSLLASAKGDHQGTRGETPWRKRCENWLPYETKRKRINMPYTGYVK